MLKKSQSLNAAVLRMAHPMAFLNFLDHIGASAGPYLRRQRLPEQCEDPQAFIPLNRAWGLFADAAEREDQDMGWLVGRHVGDYSLNAALLKKLDSAVTLLQSLRRLIRMVRVEASHLQIGMSAHDDGVMFWSRYPDIRDERGYHISQAYQLAVYIDLVRHFAGRRWFPPEIGIEASETPAILKEIYPGSRLRTSQELGYIVIPHHDLYLSLNKKHQVIRPSGRLVDTSGMNFADRLGLILEPYLSDGYPNMAFAARLLDTSPRTLARRLNGCGSSYQQLIDETRFCKARDLLAHSDAPVRDIAEVVGFSDQANFTRLFRRIAGVSPRQFRNDLTINTDR